MAARGTGNARIYLNTVPCRYRRARFSYAIDGPPGLADVDVIVAPPGQWAEMPESADPSWSTVPGRHGGVIVAIKLTA